MHFSFLETWMVRPSTLLCVSRGTCSQSFLTSGRTKHGPGDASPSLHVSFFSHSPLRNCSAKPLTLQPGQNFSQQSFSRSLSGLTAANSVYLLSALNRKLALKEDRQWWQKKKKKSGGEECCGGKRSGPCIWKTKLCELGTCLEAGTRNWNVLVRLHLVLELKRSSTFSVSASPESKFHLEHYWNWSCGADLCRSMKYRSLKWKLLAVCPDNRKLLISVK